MEFSRTKREQARYERNIAILEEYAKMLQDYPDMKTWRILRTIGDKHSLSPEGVKYVLIQQGAYVVNNETNN